MKRGKAAVALAIASVAAVLLSSCSGGSPNPAESSAPESFEGDVLRVAVYGSAIGDFGKKVLAPEFEKRTGATIEWTVGSPSDYDPAIIAAGGSNPPYDVVYLDDQSQTQLAQAGLLAESDGKKLDEISGNTLFEPLNPGMDPGMALWYTGIAYNTEKVKAAGLKEPTSWADLWDPGYAGKIDIPDIALGMGVPTIAAAAAVAGKPKDLSAGIKKLAELKANAIYSSSSSMSNDFANGNVMIASAADGRAGIMRQQGLPVKYVVPLIPGTNQSGYLERVFVDLVKGSPNLALGRVFQELVHEPAMQKEQAIATTYSPISPTVVDELVKENPALWAGQWPDPKTWDKLAVLDWPAILPQYPQLVNEYQRAFSK